MHTKNGKKNEIERTVFELSFGFFNELYLIFCKIKRKKKKSLWRQRDLNPGLLGGKPEW